MGFVPGAIFIYNRTVHYLDRGLVEDFYAPVQFIKFGFIALVALCFAYLLFRAGSQGKEQKS